MRLKCNVLPIHVQRKVTVNVKLVAFPTIVGDATSSVYAQAMPTVRPRNFAESLVKGLTAFACRTVKKVDRVAEKCCRVS